MKNFILTLVALVAFTVGAIVGPPRVASAASDQGYNGWTTKTAAYTILASENGTTFDNRGDGDAITFTLPAPFANAHYRFINHAAQAFIIAADAVDTFVVYNDATGDSLESSTIGVVREVWSDGTAWFGWWVGTSTGGTVNT